MVQLAMDGSGRTATGAADQRWNMAETFYRDSFCLAPSGGASAAPRAYTYGMFSFTKAMLLHNPGGVLTPIQFLEDRPSGASPIDWYAAQAAGGDACDGVAQTLIGLQAADGHWYGNDYYGYQYYFETAWSIIMLNKTVFVTCPQDLTGKGTKPGDGIWLRIDLTWTAIPSAASYNLLRGTASGGPYSAVGNSTQPVFTDTKALTNLNTYFYVLQPLNSGGAALGCQSNQAFKLLFLRYSSDEMNDLRPRDRLFANPEGFIL